MSVKRFLFYLQLIWLVVCSQAIAGPDLIFFEKFNNNANNWSISKNRNYYTAIKGGKFYVKHKGPSTNVFYVKSFALNTKRDFSLEAKFKFVSGEKKGNFGLAFGYVPKGKSGYFFHFKKSGHCSVNVLSRGKWKRPLIGGTAPKVMKSGNGENRVAVVFEKDKTHFLLNGVYIGSVPRIKLPGNRIGLSFQHNVVAEVDDIKVFNGTPDRMANAINAAKMYRDPGVAFHDMKVLPYEIKPGHLFGFSVDFSVIDSKRDGEKLPVSLTYLVRQGGKDLFKKSVDISVDANESFAFVKKGLISGKKPGEYQFIVGLTYQGLDYAIGQPFKIIP